MDDFVTRAHVGFLVATGPDIAAEFEERLRETGTLAFRVAYAVLRNRQDTEDVAQDAYAKAFLSFTSLRDRDRFRAWLVRTTWRLAIDRRRGERRRLTREERATTRDHTSAGTADAEATLRQSRVWEAVDRLPDRLRLVVILVSLEGHRLRDVATLLGVPEGTVKSRLFKARQQMAAYLQWLKDDTATR